MSPEFIKLRGADEKDYIFRTDEIRLVEENGCGCDIWYEYDTNDIRWYSVIETVAEVFKKLNENKFKVG